MDNQWLVQVGEMSFTELTSSRCCVSAPAAGEVAAEEPVLCDETVPETSTV